MKNLKFLTLAIAILGFTATSFAQSPVTTVTETVTAGATILKALTVVKTGELQFGKILVDDATVATIKININAAGDQITRTTEDGTVTYATTAIDAPKFVVSGSDDATFLITLPASAPLTTTGGSTTNKTMQISDFTTNLAVGTVTTQSATLVNGTKTFFVGANLNITAHQSNGVYTGTFPVTVAYN